MGDGPDAARKLSSNLGGRGGDRTNRCGLGPKPGDSPGERVSRVRCHLAPRDAEYALTLVKEHCRTRALQSAAVDALTFKCDLLWVQLEAIDAGDTRPEAARP